MPGNTRIRLLVLLAALIVTALLAGVYHLVARFVLLPTTVLADGTRATVMGVSRGGEFFTMEKSWQKLAHRVLPARWQGWVPQHFSAWADGGPNTLTVWFTLEAGSSASPGRPLEYHLDVVNDGARLPTHTTAPIRLPRVTAVNPATRTQPLPIRSVRCDTFPRRQRRFELQFSDPSGKVLGSLQVPNPFRGPFPEWAPETLPVTRTNAPLSVTLSSPFTPAMDSREPEWREAHLLGMVWSDATGNTSSASTPGSGAVALPRNERAWKLELWYGLSRTNPAAQRFLLPPLVVPGPGQLQVLTNEIVGSGWKVAVRCLAGAGVSLLTTNNGFATWSGPHAYGVEERFNLVPSSEPSLLFEWSPSCLSQELRLHLAGPGEGMSQANQWGTINAKGGRLWQMPVSPPGGTNRLTLEIYVSPVRHFEFFLDPAKVLGWNRSRT